MGRAHPSRFEEGPERFCALPPGWSASFAPCRGSSPCWEPANLSEARAPEEMPPTISLRLGDQARRRQHGFPFCSWADPMARTMSVPGHPTRSPARPAQSAELVKCVRAILRKELGKHCLAADIARRHGMVRRSLERHLSSEGTTFREISRQVQLQAAQQLLKKGASVSEVAKALGFSEVSAFTHASGGGRGKRRARGSCDTTGVRQSSRAGREHHRSADRAAQAAA